jgi:sulfide:quinone oxidoreductase
VREDGAVATTSANGGRAQVLVAGAGAAALEAVFALHDLAGDRVDVRVLAPEDWFVYRALSVLEPFGGPPAPRLALRPLLARAGAERLHDRLAGVDAGAGEALTAGRLRIPFDALVVAVGGRPLPGLPGAISFGGPESVEAIRGLLGDLERGAAERVAFAAPDAAGWNVPLYELALLTARHVASRGLEGVRLEVVTAEHAPLEVFGAASARTVRSALDDAGVAVRTSAAPVAAHTGPPEPAGGASGAASRDGLELADGTTIAADRVVTVRRLHGPAVPGLPADEHGFLPVDGHGRVAGLERVYAAGDATARGPKQGGLATQQADAVARDIANRAGAPVRPAPARAVLQGLLLTGGDPIPLRAEHEGRAPRPVAPAGEPPWWPPTKLAGRHLAPHLAAVDVTPGRPPQPAPPPPAG